MNALKSGLYTAALCLGLSATGAMADQSGGMPLTPVQKAAVSIAPQIMYGAQFIWGGSASWTCRGCGMDDIDP